MRTPEEIADRNKELERLNEELRAETEQRRQAEEQLLQSQKMESIGRLAGGVAHDFNNLLTVILGFSEVAASRLPKDAPAAADLAHVKHASERAADLTRQLLGFARKQPMALAVSDLNLLVLQVDKMLRRVIGEDIELAVIPSVPLWETRVDPAQIEQVLINMAVNARDAMPRGGRLTIETGNATLDAEYARQYPEVLPGEYVMIAVTDTGEGMTEEVRRNIFEPFFTTKEQGRGTGLGLATCYGIVKQHGGHIWCYSEPGQGTTFKVYLPRTMENAVAVVRQRDVSAVRGSETVLVAEDDAGVRSFAVYGLREMGYRVLEAESGEAALALAEANGWRIDLLLTDVVMPRMSGRALAERLRESAPGIRVLYTSGYTANTVTLEGLHEERAAFLQKPYTLSELTQKVRETLDAAVIP
jgi:signal transduction histidine kinase/ActR/RegA family two-component response regulator